jgi:RimJ/RimL family protein N-acetyltransferase
MADDVATVALTSPRLSLTSFVPGDAAESFAVTTPTLARYMGWLPSPSLEAFAEVWRAWLPQMRAGTDVYLVVRLRATGVFLGMAGLHGIGSDPTIGIWIKEAAHGSGYGREAVETVIAWASQQLGAESFIYPVMAANRPSMHLAESLGGVFASKREIRRSDGMVFEEIVYRIPTIASACRAPNRGLLQP